MLHAGPSHSGDRHHHPSHASQSQSRSQSQSQSQSQSHPQSQSQSRKQLDPQLAASQSQSRSRSPGGDSLLTIRIPTERGRRGSVIHDRGQSESSTVNDGLANLNRWSQSTTSSITSTDGPPTAFKPSHGFSGSIWARRSAIVNVAQSPEDVSPRSISNTRSMAAAAAALASPEYHRRRTPRLEKPLPPTMTLPTQSPGDGETLLTTTSYTPSSAGLLTPASYNNTTDYFGGSTPYNDKSPQNVSRASSRAPSRAQSSMSRHHDSPGNGGGGGRKDKDKKTMLSKALEKANTAVLLDNALNYEGALEAYQDACRLLESVLERTGAPEDRRKLDAIRDTYTIRIDELLQILLSSQASKTDKQLPPRPMSDESLGSPLSPSDHDSAIIETATLTRITDASPPPNGPRSSFLTSAIREVEGASSGGSFLGPLWERERSRSPFRDSALSDHTARPTDDLDSAFMPRPLTPRLKHQDDEYDHDQDYDHDHDQDTQSQHESFELPADSAASHKTDPVSWLNTIDESSSSSSRSESHLSDRSRSSSVHSHNPQDGLHRRNLSNISHTDLDFDAAFDAAVEAAYEDGYEIDQEFLAELPADPPTTIEKPPHHAPLQQEDHHVFGALHLNDDEAEEERILDDITNEYIDHGFDFDIQSKSALPRQSDSSGYSRSTWQSSMVSNRTTAGTSLSTVAEKTLPQVPEAKSSHTPSSDQIESSTETSASGGAQQISVQSRRVAGPNFKQLKIETSRKPTGLRSRGFTNTEPEAEVHELSAETAENERRVSEVPSLRHVEAALASPYHMRSAASDTATSMSLDSSVPTDSGDITSSSFRSPRPRLFRGKTRSSVSLRDHAGFIAEENSDGAPGSPMSIFQAPHAMGHDALQNSRRYVTPSAGSISIGRADSVSAGFHIFDDFLVPPNQPPSPGADDSFSPSSLEPCPESLLLRPFWLLRCVASTINQPRGGFLTTRLFVPRQVWMNRGVKLRNLEDKIANCDLLTAALGRLAKVDTYDADAVLDELQGFEEVMERVQAVLVKRLGSEVGVQGVSALFKDAPVAIDSTGTVVNETKDAAKPSTGKSYLSSWRKLRGKNSTGAVTIPLSSSRGDKEAGVMASVPMTSFLPVDKRTAHKRVVSSGSIHEGPHKEYMGSVARLCEAAQALDQIARQVEDPGLKHSSPTHIGLEIGTRHAAEFFGFYICRFLLGDLGVLMDKYVKRSTEWIVA